MKRTMTVLAMMLIFLFSSWGTALSLSLPEREAGDPGDDHGWGGDNVIDDPLESVASSSTTYVFTSVTTVDLLINETTWGRSFRNWLFRNVGTIDLQTAADRRRTEVSTNVKRNILLKGNR